jgi:putative endopeptidase
MAVLRFLLALAVLAPALAAAQPQPAPPRFSTRYMDTGADPRADFARFAFGAWQKDNPIPSDKARWGAFNELDQYNQQALKGILEAAASGKHAPGSTEQKVGDFFKSAMDTAAIDAAGLDPIKSDLARLAAIASSADLARALAEMHGAGAGGFFRIEVDADEKKSSVNALYAYQGGMSLPSKAYYSEPQFEKIRAAFVEHVAKMLALAGDSPESAASGAKTVFEVEKSLAAGARTPVELRDPIANYNRTKTAALEAKLAILKPYLAARRIAGPAASEVIVGQPEFFDGLAAQLAARPLADWKVYLRYKLLNSAAPYLAAPFEAERFRFYGTVMRGTPQQEPRWQRATRVVDGAIGEALGRLYVARYYPPEAEKRMDEMIRNIEAVMRDRLRRADWMSEATREKALAKFARFTAKIGHPVKWRDYSSVAIRPDAYLANVRAATEFEVRRRISKLGQPVDRTEWRMSPHTVNAYFDPTQNDINFPAGILQPPFFDYTADDAVNYGAIGAVIGHEITHGFDDQGRRYDADGNLAYWWTPEDAARFEARAKKLVEQFAAYEPLPGLRINGELTLGENIADLGGVSVAFEALERSLKGKERKLIDGFTPEQRFFIAYAQVWRTNVREAALRQQLSVDPHSPGAFRAVGPLSDLQPFYDAFGVKEGDPMWRAPGERAKIW